MDLLVTGATGFLGSRLIMEVVNYPQVKSILATGRNLKEQAEVIHEKVRYILGDLTDEKFVDSLFGDINIVVNCASLSSPWGSQSAFYKANVVTQANLIHAAQKSGVKRFVYISSPSIYFNFQDRFLIKESDPLPEKLVNQYAITKVAAEKLLKESNLSYVSLRPRALVGAGDTVIMPRMIRSYKEGKLRVMGDGNNNVDLTPVGNVVDAIWLAINAKEAHCNRAYNISNGEPINLWDAINDVLKRIGHSAIRKKVSYNTLYLVAYMMELKARFFTPSQEPILTRYTVGILSKSFSLDITDAKNLLGYSPRQSTQEGIDEFVHWYKKLNQ